MGGVWGIATAALLGWAATVARAAPCLPPDGSTDVTIGDPTYVCLVMNNLDWAAGGSYSQVVITPNADEYSRISVASAWQTADASTDDLLIAYGPEVGLHVESMGKISFQKAYRLSDAAQTFPILTAIVAVKDGQVTGITWDDGCHFCRDSSCQDNSYNFEGIIQNGTFAGKDCFWEDSDCIDSSTGGISDLCQLTVYVVWSGTDANGNYFNSFSKRLSIFAGEAVSNYIDDVQAQTSV